MAHRVVALSLVSAHGLKDVNVFSRMEVYAIASVYGDRSTRQRSKTDRQGASHPTWGDTFSFAVPPTAAAASASGACLHVLLRTQGLFSFGDRDVGEVLIPVADLLACACACASGGATEWQCASFQVRKVRSTQRRGTLKVSYRFGPVMAPVLRGDAAVPGDYAAWSYTQQKEQLHTGGWGSEQLSSSVSSYAAAWRRQFSEEEQLHNGAWSRAARWRLR